MKTQQKTKWWIDVVLFGGFLVAFFLDLTGVGLHQWIGVFGAALAGYHLIVHWNWVKAVSKRFFGQTSGQARAYYLIDAAILFGFTLITLTGLVISTWLDLTLASYDAWRVIHITASITTLLFVVLKLAVHWRWIVTAARSALAKPVSVPVRPAPAPQVVAVQQTAAGRTMGRREFLSVLGVSSAAGVFALSSAAQALKTADRTQTIAYAQTSSNSTASSGTTSDYSATSNTCTVRCNRGCSYPGHCRRYQDSNNNNLCDFGECL